MDWIPFVSTAGGAAIALGGTVLADQLRRRDERGRFVVSRRSKSYVKLLLAMGQGLQGLRDVAGNGLVGEEREVAAAEAVGRAGVYAAREMFLLTAPKPVVTAAEDAFEALIGVRDAVRDGAKLRSVAFHDAYHPYSETMWQLRSVMRIGLGNPRITPRDLHRSTWSDRGTCDVCVPVAPALAT